MVSARILALGFSGVINIVKAAADLSRGWGQSIDWLSLDNALEVAEASKKPIMVLVHKPTCPICQALKPKFAEHPGIQSLSQRFAMVNLMPEEVPKAGNTFYPDGAYVPRIMFFSCNCQILDVTNNELNTKKYFYKTPSRIENNMKRVLDEFANNF